MTVYRPREDSYLLQDHVKSLDLEGKKVLDMGTGTGIVAVTAAEQGADVTAVDIDPEALDVAQEKASEEDVEDRIDFVESDLFEDVSGEFDYVFFNPPYLAGDREGKDDALVGGEKGTEIIERFISEVGDYLVSEGQAFFIASSLSELDSVRKNRELDQVDSEELWFETLYLFRLGNSFL